MLAVPIVISHFLTAAQCQLQAFDGDEVVKIRRTLDRLDDPRVLELGCGTGGNLELLRRLVDRADCHQLRIGTGSAGIVAAVEALIAAPAERHRLANACRRRPDDVTIQRARIGGLSSLWERDCDLRA